MSTGIHVASRESEVGAGFPAALISSGALGRCRKGRRDACATLARCTPGNRRLTVRHGAVAGGWLLALCLGTPGALARDWDVLQAGAKHDASADCTAIFQQLLDDAGKAGGGIVVVPAGRFRFDGTLTVPANVTLQGVHRVPPTPDTPVLTNLTGSVLLSYAGRGSTNGPPFLRLAGRNAAVAGLIIAYPEWRQADVPPVPYPPCIASENTEDVGVMDCLLLNPYEAIRFVRAARHHVRNVNGYPSWRGLFVDECYDIGRVENVHFWPFGVHYDAQDPYCLWVNTQGVAFEFARTDWHYVLNTFCFGYGVGYKFSASKHGSANGNFVGLGADSCQRAVLVEQAQPPGLLFVNGEFVGRWTSTDSVCVEVGPAVEGKVSLVNCSFWGPIDRCVWMRSDRGQFTASASHFVHWDNRGVGAPAIQVDEGRALVQGCTFNEEKLHVQVGSNVVSAILTANQAPGGFQVDNRAGQRVQAGLNETGSIQWTPEALGHYRLRLGVPGDGRCLRGWHGPERGERSFRWSGPNARLLLPVTPGAAYELILDTSVPVEALSEEAGLYLNGVRVGRFGNDGRVIAQLPPSTAKEVELELRTRNWVPQESVPGSQDPRPLGLMGFEIQMRLAGSAHRIFDANDGRWLDSTSSLR